MSTPALLLIAALATPGASEAKPSPPPAEAAATQPVTTMAGTVSARSEPLTITPERLARITSYNTARLTVRDETELRGATTALAVSQPAMVGATGPGVVVIDPVFTVQTWGIYRGTTRLDPAPFLRETGETFRASDIERRIARDRRKSRRWMMVAGVGAASIAAGVIQSDQAENLPEQLLADQLTFGGIGLGVAGLMGASFPASRATRLAHYPSAVMDREDAEAMVERHNTALRERLGLTPEDLLLIELAESL